jgi:GNAT superfamily N-acetyltransferase
MIIRIREAVRKDCPRLMELIRELAVYEKAPEEVTVTLEHFEESGFGEHPVWWALVAVVDDPKQPGQDWVVGMALWYIRYSTWKGQAMYLEDLLVTESMRGQGVGKQLFDALIVKAGELGFKRLIWQVLDWNEPGINFYRKYQTHFDPGWINCALDL